MREKIHLSPAGGLEAAAHLEKVDVRVDVVRRVASSPTLKDSKRLQELFLFLCERALQDPSSAIREQEVGVAVFGRPAEYDTSEDTLVRVHASRLRKKLHQYFLGEGRHEPVIIEIPKGGYTPVFHLRAHTAGEENSPVADKPSPPPRAVNWRSALLAGIALCAVALAVMIVFTRGPSDDPIRPGAEPRPTVDRLWGQLFSNGRQTCLVISDSALTMFQDLLRRQITLSEYKRKDFAKIADEELSNAEQRVMGKALMGRYFTHIADANVAWTIGMLSAAHQVPTDVVFARDFTMSYLQSHNVILLGSRRANPWLELFEDQMNFRSRFQEQPPLAYFENRSPKPGESPQYRGSSWERQGYCRVAFLPNLTGRGNILVISGTNLASTEAGGEFVSSERWMQALGTTLHLKRRDRFPYFEVLLKMELLQAAVPKFDIVAWRIPALPQDPLPQPPRPSPPQHSPKL